MLTLTWNPPAAQRHPATCTVMASRFTLERRRSSLPFFLASLRIWRTVRSAPGCRSASIRAQPIAGVFWTLSVWDAANDLRRYSEGAGHAPHADRQRPRAAKSTFVFWDRTDGALPRWEEAKRRLAAADAAR